LKNCGFENQKKKIPSTFNRFEPKTKNFEKEKPKRKTNKICSTAKTHPGLDF